MSADVSPNPRPPPENRRRYPPQRLPATSVRESSPAWARGRRAPAAEIAVEQPFLRAPESVVAAAILAPPPEHVVGPAARRVGRHTPRRRLRPRCVPASPRRRSRNGPARAMMFLFEGAFGNVLHTGDCRLTPDCIQGLPLMYITGEGPGASQSQRPSSCRIDYLFLDCTFAKCSLQFPAKEDSIRQVINCIWEHPNARLVYLVSDMLGQEVILIEVSRAFGSKIYVDRDKNSGCYHTLSLVAPEVLIEDTSSRFQVIEFPRLSERATEMLALARGKQQPEPLIIRPSSQWYAHYASQEASLKQKPVLTKPMRDEFGVWHVCLSMHSSREELEQALRLPKWVISTTPPCLAMDLAYVKKHCFISRLGPEDPIWKLLGIPHGNSTVVGSLQAAPTLVEEIKQSEEEEDTFSAICSQVLQKEEQANGYSCS